MIDTRVIAEDACLGETHQNERNELTCGEVLQKLWSFFGSGTDLTIIIQSPYSYAIRVWLKQPGPKELVLRRLSP